ncbi:hypothetical protein GQ44DRAFT_646557 [Phaeosphaeriaceae sp. PMI808]|nr:hypothetical protein GQ44DRAFT_646557 [Phaeosphaeriaceae sp. PMI808]
MFPGSQPTRPKPPQQSALPTYAHQQRREAHEASLRPQPTSAQAIAPSTNTARPQSQIEAMPPFRTTQNFATYQPPTFYDSATRHPVFFTQNLRKPPFPIPQIASQGWSPVASGYIMEQRKALGVDPRTKL